MNFINRNTLTLHQAIFLPGVAMRVCINSMTDPAAEFHLFNKKNKDIYQLFKQNIVGGPSIILNQYHETAKTFIRNNPDKPCQKSSAMMQTHFIFGQ